MKQNKPHHNFLRRLVFAIVPVLFGLSAVMSTVSAQGLNFDLPTQTDLQTIQLPTFLNLNQIKHFSIWSYLSLVFALVFVVVAMMWVVIIVRAGVEVINSQGDQAKIKAAQKKIGNVFASIGFIFGFMVVILIVAGFFGLGSFTEWPKKLSICKDGRLYITVALEQPRADEATIEEICFNESATLDSCQLRCEPSLPSQYQYDQCVQRCLAGQ